jgi:uncharacterized protein YdeI (YjbR/CyaY-like superfamily)
VAARGQRAPAKAKSRAAKPRAFASAKAFRAWLSRHHAKSEALLVCIFKTHARARGMTYFDALDEALCFGWIDGVRRRLDDDSFSIRFSPRRAGSIWSGINIRRAKALVKAGRMHAAGLAAMKARTTKRSRIYAYESRPKNLSPEYQREFQRNAPAWKFYRALPPWYQRNAAFWVMSAKQEATRARRLSHLIDCCARRVAIHPLLAAKIKAFLSPPR